MDTESLREMVAKLEVERKAVEERLDAIKMAKRGLARMLKSLENGTQPESPFAERYRAKGAVSVRGTLLQVMEDAAGEPMHVKDIWNEVKRRGAISNAKDPPSAIDLNLIALSRQGFPLEKTGTRIWRWIGGEARE